MCPFSDIKIIVKSFGCDDAGPPEQPIKSCDDSPSSVTINGIEHSLMKYGMNIVVLSRELGHVYAKRNFDFSNDENAVKRFGSFIDSMPTNAIVIGSVKGDASRNFNENGLAILASTFHAIIMAEFLHYRNIIKLI